MAYPPAHARVFKIINALHYTSPPLTVIYWLVTLTVSVCMLHNLSQKVMPSKARRNVVAWLLAGVITTYVSEAAFLLLHSMTEKGWWASQDTFIYVLASFLVWGIQLVALTDTEYPVWYPYYGSWLITFIAEFTLLVLYNVPRRRHSPYETLQIVIQVLRICLLILLPCSLFGPSLSRANQLSGRNDEESQALLTPSPEAQGNAKASGYGTTDTKGKLDAKEERRKRLQERLEKDGNWWNYMKGYSMFIPLVWPSKDKLLQARMVLVGICLLLTRALNVLVPRQLGIVTNALADGGPRGPWLEVLLFAIFTLLNSSAGVGGLKSYLWQPLEQYSYQAISTAAYNQIMELDSEFHNSKKTGDLFNSISQGRSVSDLLESLLFEILPMLIDLIVACGYLYHLFDAYMALLIAGVGFTYIWISVKLGARTTTIRRSYVDKARKEWGLMYDTVGAWQTVSHFNRVAYEEDRYSNAVIDHLGSRRYYLSVSIIMRGIQSTVMQMGKLAACFLAVYQVRQGSKSVGAFVTLLTYWGQLSGPLEFFASAQRQLMNNLLDAEGLLELLRTKPGVVDRRDAKALQLVNGAVEFDNVDFTYDQRKQTLKGVQFRAEPGQTIALVGETGGGKSTILKLLLRFYDVGDGSIKIDGQDIRDVRLRSLRDNIGVVPQDPTLFNDSIMVNVRYARLDATDEDVHNACKAAAIHDKIMTFPDGYQSKVGERGVRLSGGELQRLSIARAILKGPRIVLLDEATSMIDTETEQQIQEAFRKLTKDRTTFVVAHRLSTIMNADVILVIKDGTIIEQGNHRELRKMKGKYYNLWSKQIFSGKDGSRSRSPEKEQKPVMFNDLTSENRFQTDTGSSESNPYQKEDQENQTSNNELGLDGSVENTSSETRLGHGDRNEVNGQEGRAQKGTLTTLRDKLFRPDAPEFIPQFLRGSKSEVTPLSKGSHSPTAIDMHRAQQTEGSEPSAERKQRLKREADNQKQEKSERKARDRETKERTAVARKAAKQIVEGTRGTQPSATTEEANNNLSLSELSPEPFDEGNKGNKTLDVSDKGKKRGFRSFSSRGKSKASKSNDSQGISFQAETERKLPSSSTEADATQPIGPDGEGHVEFRIPTRGRRPMSKSDPAGHGCEETGTMDDFEPHPESSAGGQPPNPAHRRVSAPSDPPSGQGQNARRVGHVGRRRRPRHGHQRKQKSSGTGSAGGTSSSWNESPVDQTPGAPVTSPADGAKSSAGLAHAPSASHNR
ncbi:MAG: hypothetical protein M1836_007094 [Candelina mexicana]|nr:MAG: hypothetical protein M1836_007094 [Candelina mexicana]